MNSDLQNKLQQFSADPPEGVWNKIADALDAEEAFAQRLYEFEEMPPSASWQKIEQQLDTQPEQGKVVPLRKRFTKPMRYVAVAGILAIIMVTITMTMKRTEAGALGTDGTTVAPATSLPVTAGTPKNDNVQRSNPGSQATEKNSNKTLPGSPSRTVSQNAGKRTLNTAPVNTSLNDYVTYSDGQGKVMKISRKMETLVNCKDGDWQCQQRLQQLRQKMAAKAMTTDFTGILEMLQQLQ